MTRPQMIRADTMDLQGPLAPSAKNHIKPETNGKIGKHAPGAHQDQALRNAEQDMIEEIARGPLSPDPRKDAYEEEYALSDQDEPTDGINGLRDEQLGGYENHMDDDVGEGDIDDLDDDMLDKISSSPSIDDEDIDFEFVYALHTFVATVEGQANATKGDTMVLLDDSNSYWWLVRVVKDGSIGYLPAEHIETPTERLARLNKHRNIDLSATMLGDNAEKSKNPLKKAMRRRNAKTVTFASPTYFEASDIDYSTEEEDMEDDLFDEDEEDDVEHSDSQDAQDDTKAGNIVVEPLRPKPQTARQPVKSQDEEQTRDSLEQTQESREFAGQQEEFRHGRSRNGVFRNTDSFFKDDTVETKKISLTPNLLRDDTNNEGTEVREMRGRGSFEALMGDRNKDDKKRKEKKSGMLSGFFKRKDKKNRSFDDDGEEHEKVSEESVRSSTERKMSTDSLNSDIRPSKPQVAAAAAAAPQRAPSKLQKQPAGVTSPTADPASPVKSNITPSVRAVAPESSKDEPSPTVSVRVSESQQDPPSATTPGSVPNSAASSPLSPSFRITPTRSIDIIDTKSPDFPTPTLSPIKEKEDEKPMSPTEPTFEPATQQSPLEEPPQREDDLPILTKRRSSPDESSVSTRSLSQPSSEILDMQPTKIDHIAPAASASASPASSPLWNDAYLRAYLEDGSDIKDLLIIVHDKSNVLPAGPDHPVTGSLFKEESKALNEMSHRLDDMLTGWLARKSLVAAR